MLKKVHGLKSYSRGLARQIVDRQDIMVTPNEKVIIGVPGSRMSRFAQQDVENTGGLMLNDIDLILKLNKTRLRSNIIMDDIFYMSSKNVSIKDINKIVKRMNVKSTFMSKTSEVIEIEYSDSVVASWFCMRLDDFQEVEDKKFLIENQIKSIFCISHHSNNFPSILPHLK